MRGRDLDKWRISYKNYYIIIVKYGEGEFLENNYPSIYNYLSLHENKLKNRGQVKVNQHHWLELDNNPSSKYIDLFKKEKIMYGEIVPEPRFIYDKGFYFMEATGFILNSSTINIKYLLSLLNSKLLFWYFKDIGYNLGGKGYRYKKIFIEQLPVKFTDSTNEEKINKLVDELINLNEMITKIKNEFIELMLKEYNVKKISKKLDEFYKLNSQDFLKEVKKQKGVISNKEKIDLEFVNKSFEINENIKKIDEIEDELNKIIYDIYQLNQKEIKIIENQLI